MEPEPTPGSEVFDEGPWRRKQLLVTIGITVLALGFIVFIVAQWGEVCSEDACWGNGAGSAAPTAMVGLALCIIGIGVVIMGVVMKAPEQVILVPDGEVTLSRTRVMLREEWDGDRFTLVVAGREVPCGRGDQLLVGDTRYVIWSVDPTRQWVTVRPLPDQPAPEAATA